MSEPLRVKTLRETIEAYGQGEIPPPPPSTGVTLLDDDIPDLIEPPRATKPSDKTPPSPVARIPQDTVNQVEPASVETAFKAMAHILEKVKTTKEITVILPTAEKGRDGEISVTEGVSLSLSTPMFIRESDCVSFIYDNRYLRINVTVGVSLGLVVDDDRLECVAMMRSVPLPGTTWSFISFVLPTA